MPAIDDLKYEIEKKPSIFSFGDKYASLNATYIQANAVNAYKTTQVIKNTLIEIIDLRLAVFKLTTAKRNVLCSLRQFVDSPTELAWGMVCKTVFENPEYHKGLASRVLDIFYKVKKLHPKETNMLDIENRLLLKSKLYTLESIKNNVQLQSKSIPEEYVTEIYAFIQGSKCWKNVPIEIQTFAKNNSAINKILNEHCVARMKIPSIDISAVDIYDYLASHPSQGSKQNVLFALINFIEDMDFSVERVYQAI